MTRPTQAAVPPLQFEEPIVLTSELGHRLDVRHQRIRVTPDIWVTVFSDGRITVTSYTHDLNLQHLNEYRVVKGGSTLTLHPTPKAPAFVFGPGPREADVPVEP